MSRVDPPKWAADESSATRSSPGLPTGTVTFVMTDVEGSTRLAFSSAGGVEVSTAGDALFFVFVDAASAVRATLTGQRSLATHPWPAGTTVRVRMGIHSGEGRLLGGDYVGIDVHRVARIANAAHGGQVLLSDAARALSEGALPEGASLRDLGRHRLKDLERAEHLFQLVAAGLDAEVPQLRFVEASPSNLPAHMTSFVGRERERRSICSTYSPRAAL